MMDEAPAYLRDLLDESQTYRRTAAMDASVLRRCRRCLPVIWAGLVAYLGDPLVCRSAWEDRVRPQILQRWYATWSQRAADPAPPPAHLLRWVRYTLNRLAASESAGRFRVQLRTRVAYLPLRLSAHQEHGVVTALAPPLTERQRYCLRRFVVGFPLWDVAAARAVTAEDVDWWCTVRAPEVVPSKHQGWFESVLRPTLRACGMGGAPSVTEARTGLEPRRTAPLLYTCPGDGVDVASIPPSAQLFFRHFFDTDAVVYVRRLQRAFAGADFTVTHQRQVWDFVREFWYWVATHHHGGSRVIPTEHATDITECVWPFLLDVYRAQGGGGVGRTERLPTPCIKALSAVRYGLRVAGQTPDPPPTRREYRRQIRMVHAEEEGTVARVPVAPPTHGRRTYTAAECGALLGACQTHRDRLLLLLLQRVGLRNAALRRLALRDVTEETPPHHPVTTGRAYEKGGVIRPFLLDAPLRDCLIAYLSEEYGRHCTRPQWHTACVFPRCHTEPNHPMTAGQLHFWFGCLRRRAGVHGPHATIHGFRHYLVTTLMADRRNRLCDVSAWIGHRSVATTANCYWHTDVQEVHERLVFPWTNP